MWMHNWHKRFGTVYMTSGVGYGKSELSAFDAAEIDANIVCANAVKVSSFIPPTWRIVNSKDDLLRLTDYGALLPRKGRKKSSMAFNQEVDCRLISNACGS